MKKVIHVDDLADDVPGAEELVETQKWYSMDLYRPFQAFEQIGQRVMVEEKDYNVFLYEIQDKLDSIRVARAELKGPWSWINAWNCKNSIQIAI